MGGKDGDFVLNKILNTGAPMARGTKADNVRLADESEFVGISTRGGLSTVDKAAAGGLADLLDRTDADIRGRKISEPKAKPEMNRRASGSYVVENAPKKKGKKAPSATPSKGKPTMARYLKAELRKLQ